MRAAVQAPLQPLHIRPLQAYQAAVRMQQQQQQQQHQQQQQQQHIQPWWRQQSNGACRPTICSCQQQPCLKQCQQQQQLQRAQLQRLLQQQQQPRRQPALFPEPPRQCFANWDLPESVALASSSQQQQ